MLLDYWYMGGTSCWKFCISALLLQRASIMLAVPCTCTAARDCLPRSQHGFATTSSADRFYHILPSRGCPGEVAPLQSGLQLTFRECVHCSSCRKLREHGPWREPTVDRLKKAYCRLNLVASCGDVYNQQSPLEIRVALYSFRQPTLSIRGEDSQFTADRANRFNKIMHGAKMFDAKRWRVGLCSLQVSLRWPLACAACVQLAAVNSCWHFTRN